MDSMLILKIIGAAIICLTVLGFTVTYIVLFIYGFIQGIKEGPDKEQQYSSYSDYEEPEVYQNSNFWGTHDGRAIIQGDKITHTDWLGTHTGYSEIRDDGRRIQHKNFWGQYDGHTEMRGDDRMVHYDEWGQISGYSVKQNDGSWRNEDVFGVTQSYSRKLE